MSFRRADEGSRTLVISLEVQPDVHPSIFSHNQIYSMIIYYIILYGIMQLNIFEICLSIFDFLFNRLDNRCFNLLFSKNPQVFFVISPQS